MASATGCKFTWQTKNAKGQCVGCPPNTTWDNAKKQCVASATPAAAPVPNLSSIPAPVALDCKDPKHWVNDQCLCKDQNMEDPPGGDASTWCTVRKAPAWGSWEWRTNRCKQLGADFYVCSERDIQYDMSSATGNPQYRGVDLPNQCCRDSNYKCGGGGFLDALGDGIFRGSRARNRGNNQCVDVYTAEEGRELGLNAGGGPLSWTDVIIPVNPVTAGKSAAKKVVTEVAGAAIKTGTKTGAKAAPKYAAVQNPDGTISQVAVRVDTPAAAAAVGKGTPAAATGKGSEGLAGIVALPAVTVGAGLGGRVVNESSPAADVPVGMPEVLQSVEMGKSTALGLIDPNQSYSDIIDPDDDGSHDECSNCVNTAEDGTCRRCGDNDW